MDCLKCPNYWKTDIDETKCDQCGCGRTIVDVVVGMPPLNCGPPRPIEGCLI